MLGLSGSLCAPAAFCGKVRSEGLDCVTPAVVRVASIASLSLQQRSEQSCSPRIVSCLASALDGPALALVFFALLGASCLSIIMVRVLKCESWRTCFGGGSGFSIGRVRRALVS